MPPAPPTLRPYQREAIDAVLRARRAGQRRLLVCLPTGAGKTVIFSELARMAKRPVLVLAHRKELVDHYRDTFANPYKAAALGYVDDVLDPVDTRRRLIAAFDALEDKREQLPPRKHGNIPL